MLLNKTSHLKDKGKLVNMIHFDFSTIFDTVSSAILWFSEAFWGSMVKMKSSSGRCMYLSPALEEILKIQRGLCRAQLYLIVSIVTEDAKKVQFILLAADTMQARLVNPLDQDQDQNKKSSFEIEPMSWNQKGHKGKTMGKKKDMRFIQVHRIKYYFWLHF